MPQRVLRSPSPQDLTKRVANLPRELPFKMKPAEEEALQKQMIGAGVSRTKSMLQIFLSSPPPPPTPPVGPSRHRGFLLAGRARRPPCQGAWWLGLWLELCGAGSIHQRRRRPRRRRRRRPKAIERFRGFGLQDAPEPEETGLQNLPCLAFWMRLQQPVVQLLGRKPMYRIHSGSKEGPSQECPEEAAPQSRRKGKEDFVQP